MLLAAILISVLSVQIWWTCRCIRSDFHARGMRVRRVRWQPLAALLSLRWTRHDMLYRVWYLDRDGAAFSCRVVAAVAGGIAIEDERREFTHQRALPVAALSSLPWASVACSVGGCVAMGLSYWSLPYNRVNLPNGLFTPGLVLLAISAIALQFHAPRRWLSTFPILAMAPVGTILVRVVLDGMRDASTHNLLPFEIILAGIVGGLSVAIGMGIGWILRRLLY